jgi:putative phosphoesterase
MIVIMSDSHSERRVIESIKNEYKDKTSAIIHCGDSELPSDDKIWQGITVVAGNCDYDPGYKGFQLLEADGQRIVVTHGHLYGLNVLTLGTLPYLAEQELADVLCFGHVHRPVAELIDKRLFINPGSVAQPRGDWQIKMYAVIDVFEDSVHKSFDISYRNLQHQPIPELQLRLEVLK